jgi:hypothetical protein
MGQTAISSIFSLAANAIISVLCSWVVAWVYFRKVTRAEQVGEQIRHGLQRALLPTLYPQFFDQERSLSVYPDQRTPANQDIPYVEVARIHPRIIAPGSKFEVLLKLRDAGFDLDNPDGVSIRDHHGQAVGVIGLGLGFCMCTVHVEKSPASYAGSLTVELKDIGAHTKAASNHNVQTLRFLIEKETHDARQAPAAQ